MHLKINDGIADCGLSDLEEILSLIDAKLIGGYRKVQEAIDNSVSPSDLGLMDYEDYLVGIGFVACQKYMSSIFGYMRQFDKSTALKIGPINENGVPVVKIINAAANYWKHNDEWGFFESDDEMNKLYKKSF